MGAQQTKAGLATNRLSAAEYAENFQLTACEMTLEQAKEAAELCVFCEDPPCVRACPTKIDVPSFMERIINEDPTEAARTIFEQNVLGGICAHVCPKETLCEGACVYVEREQPPVKIAELQAFATHHVLDNDIDLFERAKPSGQRVAVVGAGPAGLACAHRLALKGHDVVVMDARHKPGGLSEYGIAAYKLPTGFAQKEIAWLLEIGGIELRMDTHLGRDTTLTELRDSYDAVFLAMGMAGVNALRTDGPDKENVVDAIDFISNLRQADDPSKVPVGRHVVVLGGGRTAIDAAVQARLLGAEAVTLAYKDHEDAMDASEQDRIHAASKGVRILTGAVPQRFLGRTKVEAVEFAHAFPDETGLRPGGETFQVKADHVLKAIGQHVTGAPAGLRLDGTHIAVDANGKTSLENVWAGGDCASGERDLMVQAVAQGRDAAEDIHHFLTA